MEQRVENVSGVWNCPHMEMLYIEACVCQIPVKGCFEFQDGNISHSFIPHLFSTVSFSTPGKLSDIFVCLDATRTHT